MIIIYKNINVILIMANNTLTLSSPGKATISWKVKLGEKELDNVDSLVLNINDEKMDITHQYEDGSIVLDVSKNTTFYMDAESGDYASRSSKIHLKIIGGGIYYGTLNIPTSDIDKFGWEIIKTELEEYIQTLMDENLLKEMIDENPIELEGELIANPGKLVLISPEESDKIFETHKFFGADENIEESRPVLIYPAEFGQIATIKDSMGNEMYNKETSSNDNEKGFMMEKIVIGDKVEHFVYIQKSSISNDSEIGALPYTFNKD